MTTPVPAGQSRQGDDRSVVKTAAAAMRVVFWKGRSRLPLVLTRKSPPLMGHNEVATGLQRKLESANDAPDETPHAQKAGLCRQDHVRFVSVVHR